MLDVAPAAAARIAGERMPRRIARALSRYRHGPGTLQGRLRRRGRGPVGLRARAPGRNRARRRQPEEIAADEKLRPRRAHARSAVRARLPAVPGRPAPLAGRRASGVRLRPRPGRLHRRRHRPDRSADRTVRPRVPRPDPRPHVRSVAQMEAHNANYVGGDVVTGSNDPLQLVFRPRVALDPYWTGIPASTSARRPRLPAPAPTGCAATTPRFGAAADRS